MPNTRKTRQKMMTMLIMGSTDRKRQFTTARIPDQREMMRKGLSARITRKALTKSRAESLNSRLRIDVVTTTKSRTFQPLRR